MDLKLLLLAFDDKYSKTLKLLEDKVSKVKAMKGDTGPVGPAGPKGDVGPKGADGKAGKEGKSGTNGKDGKDGSTGADGVGIEEAQIDLDGHLVFTLSDGNEIDAGDIRPLTDDKPSSVTYNVSSTSYSRADLGKAEAKIISENYTTVNTVILKVTQSVDILLNETPQDRETVLINCATDDKITITGFINIVNPDYYNIAEFSIGEFGYASLAVEQKNTSIHLMYVQEFGEWLAI